MIGRVKTGALLLLTMLAAGCGNPGRPTASPTGPVRLPPSRTPVLATLTPEAVASRPLPTSTVPTTPTWTPSPFPTDEAEASPIPSATAHLPAGIPIAALDAGMLGQEVTVVGTVTGADSFSAGFTFALSDGSGEVALLMWHDVYDDCWDAPEINLGARVRVTGELGQYDAQLQIQPSWGGAVRVLEPGPDWAAVRSIGSLSSEDQGTRVVIEGTVTRTEGLTSAVRVFVSDASGEIVVFIWRGILDRISGNTALGTPGSTVRVAGSVQEYRGAMELVPALPYDVIVLAVP